MYAEEVVSYLFLISLYYAHMPFDPIETLNRGHYYSHDFHFVDMKLLLSYIIRKIIKWINKYEIKYETIIAKIATKLLLGGEMSALGYFGLSRTQT